jgi:hypothetical protein
MGGPVQITAQSTIAASEKALDSLAKAPLGKALRLPNNLRHLAGGRGCPLR